MNFRLAKHLKRMGVPVIWFVSPQLWAWKRGRLRWVQQRVSKMLTIFPFEQAFYAARGVEAEFVGHPLAEQALPTISREEYAAEWKLALDRPWIALLPGSRSGEIRANLPEIVRAAELVGDAYQYLIPIAPTVSEQVQREISDAIAPFESVQVVRDARAALLHSRAAVVASGTATVQAAVIGTPFVVVYRVSKLTFAAAKRLVRYPIEISAEKDDHGHLPIAMVNLVAGRRVVPELLQEQFTAQNVAEKLLPLLAAAPPKASVTEEPWWSKEGNLSEQEIHSEDVRYMSQERRAQKTDLARVRRQLQSPTGQPGIERLRDAVLTALNGAAGPAYAAEASASNE